MLKPAQIVMAALACHIISADGAVPTWFNCTAPGDLNVTFAAPVGAIHCGSRHLDNCPTGPNSVVQTEPAVQYALAEDAAGYTVMCASPIWTVLRGVLQTFTLPPAMRPLHTRQSTILLTQVVIGAFRMIDGSISRRHWLVGNVPGSVVRKGFKSEEATGGDVLQPYHGPHPPHGQYTLPSIYVYASLSVYLCACLCVALCVT